jgi:hypothetical protein
VAELARPTLPLPQTHTAQNWADTYISELNDTHVEADLRMRHAPPPLDVQVCGWGPGPGPGLPALPGLGGWARAGWAWWAGAWAHQGQAATRRAGLGGCLGMGTAQRT